MRPVRGSIRDVGFSIREISERIVQQDDPVRFDIGQPDFGTPDVVRRRMQDVMADDHITYTPLWGIDPLRDEIARQEGEKFPDGLSRDGVLVTTGGTGALFCLLDTLLDDGASVVTNDPAWSPYRMVAAATPGEMRQVPYFHDDGSVAADRVRDAIDDDTRALILNTPENPTGRVYSQDAVETLGGIAAAHDLTIVADEVYDRLVFDDARHVSPAGKFPDRTVVVNSVSKNYAMTGWRIGWLAHPDPDLIHEIGKVNRATTASPNYPAQQAALTALQDCRGYADEMRAAFRARRDAVMEHVAELGWDCVTPGGAIYVFPDVQQDSWTFARRLIEEQAVSVVPGEPFGSASDTNVRLCFGSVDEDGIHEGFARIKQFA